jgi:uncharacterized OsmC-like protein
MNTRIIQNLFVALGLMFVIMLSSCVSLPESAAEGAQAASKDSQVAAETPQLATARVSAKLTEPGRVTVTGHNDLQFSVNAMPSAEGLQEIDTLLAAQATCGVFVAEKAAQELDVPLSGATATTVFDEDRQKVHVYLDLPGANSDQILELANHLRQRCPIYTTLAEAESIEFLPGEQVKSVVDEAAMVTATLFRFGGANVTAGDNTFVMDSVPPLDGPNEELNPLDLMLGGLAACSRFVYESEAPQANVTTVVEGDLDPSGVRDIDGPNPRIQKMRVSMQVDEYDKGQAEKVKEQIKEQCYLYKMLNGTVDIEISAEPLES